MPNYQEIAERYLPMREPFTHSNSMSAVRSGNEYLVYSYRTLIAKCELDTGEWWIDDTKYSRTTSKQQNLIRRVIGAVS